MENEGPDARTGKCIQELSEMADDMSGSPGHSVRKFSDSITVRSH